MAGGEAGGVVAYYANETLENQKTSWEEFLSIQMLCWELWARVRVSNIMSNKTIQNIREKV